MPTSPFTPRPESPRGTASRWTRSGALGLGAVLAFGGLAACDASADEGTPEAADEVAALFDTSTVHDVEVTFDDAEYDEMIATFLADGDKSWVTATVTIDGETFENVGLRLKGNSSLRDLTTEKAEDPSTLPWLIRLDKFTDGQAYDGTTSFVVRSSTTATAMNEAVALELIGLSGLATEEATASRFSINGGDEALRLIIENPDEAWVATQFDASGLLYKAEADGDYSYRGDDPASYEDIFDQETGEDDLAPLIELLSFLDSSDDETFAAELADHLDVDAFATYLAVQELVANFDDISGPGNNSYLFYDADAERFTVVAWDQNLSFGTSNGGGFGGGGAGGPEGDTAGRGQGTDEGAAGQRPDGAPTGAPGAMPTGMPTGAPGEMPPGMPGEMPTDAAGVMPDGAPDMTGQSFPAGGMGGGMMGGNVLAERFMADDTFAALYESALADLTERLVESGTASEILDTWTTLLTDQASDLVDTETIESEAAAIAEYLD